MSYPDNLKIITNTRLGETAQALEDEGVKYAHITNGTYTAPDEMVVPTTLAGFQYITDTIHLPEDTYIIAVNSDVSMQKINDAKGGSLTDIEDQQTRAEKVLVPLALQHPETQIIGIFYDEETPEDLYEYLSTQSSLSLESLFKFGYGTNPDAPRIEGATHFRRVFGFPFPNDAKALCHDITVAEDQSDTVIVENLAEEKGLHGAPYITPENKVLFKVHEDLKGHQDPAADTIKPDYGLRRSNKLKL